MRGPVPGAYRPHPRPLRAPRRPMSRAIPLPQARPPPLAIVPRRPARASSSSSSPRRSRSLLRASSASTSEPFPLESTHGCHTGGCCTNDLVASLEARAGCPGALEDVNLRECGDGDVVAALAARAGEISTGSLAADILWYVTSTPVCATCASRAPPRRHVRQARAVPGAARAVQRQRRAAGVDAGG